MNQAILQEVLENYNFSGKVASCQPYGSGHINDTYCVVCEGEGGRPRRYILQRMNDGIFANIDQLMENIVNVTSYLRRQILLRGGDPERETMNLLPTQKGKNYYTDSQGGYWRVYLFIEDAVCLDKVEKPEDFYETAVAFGNFQRLLAGFPADTLHETIPNFHNTISRFQDFERFVQADACGRAAGVQEEIRFAMARREEAGTLVRMQQEGRLPLRVTHNDTKLNNVMLDAKTGRGVCVIDLDTVMPGLALNDFGDSIRFGASTAAEDEQDLSKVSVDLNLYELYLKGFLEGCGGSLTQAEIDAMPMGAKLMTLECGIRFLGDYLDGDHYFKIHREGHNLDRARTQFKLVADMEAKWEQLTEITRRAAGQAT
ncbi:MAG TPA: aminoglycoside phosphotransferase family protein [Candidatus Caccousia avistercoris]|nr:aminoglycoside phosphotransferase family protein [Candidatus Caccousia avistercoris]